MYAIFLSLVAIIMLLLNLLFGSNVDVGNIVKATSFCTIDWLSTVICITVLTFRFVLIYLIFDFFIITIYAICSLYSFVGLQMKRSNAKVDQYKPHNIESDYNTFTNKYKLWQALVLAIVIFVFAVLNLVFIFKGNK